MHNSWSQLSVYFFFTLITQYFNSLGQNYLGPWVKFGSLPIKKVLLGKKSNFICFHILYGCFWATIAELSTHNKNRIIKMLLALCRECLLIPDLRHWPRPLICKCLRGLDYINSKFYATSCLLSCFH